LPRWAGVGPAPSSSLRRRCPLVGASPMRPLAGSRCPRSGPPPRTILATGLRRRPLAGVIVRSPAPWQRRGQGWQRREREEGGGGGWRRSSGAGAAARVALEEEEDVRAGIGLGFLDRIGGTVLSHWRFLEFFLQLKRNTQVGAQVATATQCKWEDSPPTDRCPP
jgi:hypothetical protein